MTLETLYCAVCGERTAPDVDHVELAAEHVLLEAPNRRDAWVLHADCYRALIEGWHDPV